MSNEASKATNPQTDIMGVEISQEKEWHIDFLTVTTWGIDLQEYFEGWFSYTLGEMVDKKHGGRFYSVTWQSEVGVIVRKEPYDGSDRQTIEIPGTACQLIGYDRLCAWFQGVNREASRVQIARIDVAFDHCGFTPGQLYQAFRSDSLRTLAKRDTIKFYEAPLEKKEDNTLGTSGVTIGSRSSERYCRCYDKHGFTRLEVEYKEAKGNQVGYDLLYAGTPEEALRMAMGHLLDYFDLASVTWWEEFRTSFSRLYSKLSKTCKELVLDKKIAWLRKSVSATLHACRIVCGYDLMRELENIGNKKVMSESKYQAILSLSY